MSTLRERTGRASPSSCSDSGRTEGRHLIEYCLLLPLLFLLIVNVVNFGGFFCAWITVANAARAGADYAIMSGASAGAPRQATATQITSLITQDISSLPNRASLVVNICQNNNGTIKTLSGTCTSIPADTEPSSFILTSIDVTYTYQPFIPVFQFTNLSIYATIPATTVHRRAVMRVIQ
jgi:Flp pilus assembly protein TadG